MNSHYSDVFGLLGFPKAIADCAMGDIELPIATFQSPGEWLGFPPALCPIWCDASSLIYIGLWKHWFTPRETSFVKMYIRSGRSVKEIARTPTQLFSHMCITALGANEGVNGSVEQFAHAVGIQDLAELDAISLRTGDDPVGFALLSDFQSDTPLASIRVPSRYDGAFPTDDRPCKAELWSNVSHFELTEASRARWLATGSLPDWIFPVDRLQCFRKHLNEKNLFKAWLILNSPGWLLGDAVDAIEQLAIVAKDRIFSRLSQAWIEAAGESIDDSLCY